MPSRKPAAAVPTAARRGRRSPRTRRRPGRRPVPFVALTAAAVATATGLLPPPAARAQTIHDYTGSTGTASAPSNGLFSTGFTPALTTGSITTLLRFGGGSYTATNNLTSDLTVNGLTFTNTGAVVLGRGGAANAANRLVLDGSDPTLTLNNIGSLRIALDLLLNATARFTGDGSATLTGVLSGAGGLTKSGTGTLRLTGIGSSISGAAYFNGGTTLINGLTASSYGTLATGAGEIGRDAGTVATVTVSGTDGNGNASSWSTGNAQLVVGGSGTGTLNVQGGGRVSSAFVNLGVFAGSSGTATISGAGSSLTTTASLLYVGSDGAGTLNVLDGGSVTTTGEMRIALGGGSSASLIVNGGRLTTDSLSIGLGTVSAFKLTNPTAADGGGYALTLGGNNANSTIGVVIADAAAGDGGAAGIGGAGGIRKVGTGTLRLNAANTFSDGMLIEGGSVILGNALALQNSTVTLNVTNGLNVTSQANVTLGGLEGAGALNLGGTTSITVGNNNASTTYGGILTGSGRLTKVGTGTLRLTGIGSNVESSARFNGGTTLITGATAASYATLATGGGSIGRDANTVATVTVSGTDGNGNASAWSTGTSQLVVGDLGTGTLNILGGGRVSGGDVLLATSASAGSSGTATVSGAGSSLNLGANLLRIGFIGAGTLNVLDGGGVTSGFISLGVFAGSSGTATVSGSGSSLNTGANSLTVGFQGAGTLNVLDGGSVTVGGETLLASTVASSGSLIVNGGRLTTGILSIGVGTASTIRLTNPTAANGGGYALNVGTNNASSTIGVVIADAAAGAGGAAGLGGAGGIRKTGTGALTLNAANTFSGGMLIEGGSVVVGDELALQNSTTVINVANGLNLNNRAAVTLGGLEGTGALSLGTTTPTALTVGRNNASTTYGGVLSGGGSLNKVGTGTLTLTGIGSGSGGVAYFNGGTTLINGLTASSYATLATGSGEIGRDAGTVATVTVSGNDGGGNASSWSTGGTQLLVGVSGTGTLNVQNGGRVSGGFVKLGVLASSSGTATVSGAGSSLDTGANFLHVGVEGTGTLNVQDGGSVNTSFGGTLGVSVGSSGTATVSGSGSSLTTGANSLTLGFQGTGTLNILGGGNVSGGQIEMGIFAGSSGTATVSGSGSSLTTGASGLLLGFQGAGTLNILDGGSVSTNGLTRLADEDGSSGALVVNGGRLNTGRLTVGSGTASAIKLTNPTAANGGGYALNLGGTNNGNSTIGVVIADAAAGEGGAAGVGGAGGIRKTGGGTLTLTGANTYSGGTLIEDGRVVARGGTIIGTALVSGGLGTGAVTIASGATLSVGRAANATVGTALGGFPTLAVSSLTLTGGSDTPLLTFNLGATGQSDLLRFSGDANSLAFSGSGTFAIGFASAPGASIVGPQSYLLMSFATPLSAGNVSLAEPNGRFTAVGTGNLRAPRGAAFSWQTNGSGQITGLLFGTTGADAVPEPGSIALLLAGLPLGAGVLAGRRRRRA